MNFLFYRSNRYDTSARSVLNGLLGEASSKARSSERSRGYAAFMKVNCKLMRTVLTLLTFHLVFQARRSDSHVYLITDTWVHLSKLFTRYVYPC